MPPTMEPILAPYVPFWPIDAPYDSIRVPFSPIWDPIDPKVSTRGPQVVPVEGKVGQGDHSVTFWPMAIWSHMGMCVHWPSS